MNFQHRPIEPRDFPACMGLMYDRFLYDGPGRQRLAGLWADALTNGRAPSAVVEGVAPDGSRRVLGFGLNVFVTDAFAAELRSGGLPFYVPHILECHRVRRSPMLDRKAIGAGNAGPGLCVVGLGVGHVRRDEVPPDVFHGVLGAMLASSQQAHRGYHIREVFAEACGEPLRDLLVAGGFRLRADYRAFFSRHPQPPPAEHWPYLLGLTREEAVANPFCTLGYWFHHNRPQFAFRPAEQEMLERALAGQTDEELAVSLSLSPWTVKKRWQSIYARLETVRPGLLPQEAADGQTGKKASRGAERRRHLLLYLREHMEELRPH